MRIYYWFDARSNDRNCLSAIDRTGMSARRNFGLAEREFIDCVVSGIAIRLLSFPRLLKQREFVGNGRMCFDFQNLLKGCVCFVLIECSHGVCHRPSTWTTPITTTA